MIHFAAESRAALKPRSAVERVREYAQAFGCRAWARASGPHILLGVGPEEAFARITPLGGLAYGLAFRGDGVQWAPVLLVDTLTDVVEHALVAEGILGEAGGAPTRL